MTYSEKDKQHQGEEFDEQETAVVRTQWF